MGRGTTNPFPYFSFKTLKIKLDMKKIDLYISNNVPAVSNGAAWLKPVNGGYALYVLDNGWKPLKLVDDKNTPSVGDDTVKNTKAELIGSVQDEASANTINGAKAYATSVGAELVGDATDASSNMTLYGIKNYIDEQIAAIE